MNESAAKDHGLLYKGEMVCAILRDVDPKTQTRRPVTFDNSIETRTVNEINAFKALWDSINVARGFSWDGNHPVWAYGFKQVTNG